MTDIPDTSYSSYLSKSLVKRIIDRQERFETLRQPYDDRMADIVDFCDPGLTAWNTREDTEGTIRGNKLYEGTPSWALRIMADGWLGNLVSDQNPWLKYVFSLRVLRDNDKVNQWLQDLEDYMYSVYRQSEIYFALAPYTRVALSVGSPVIIPYEDRKAKKIKCEVPHPKENYHGPNDAYHRKYQLTALEVVDKFLKGKLPEDTSELMLSNDLINNYKSGNHYQKYWFIRAIYRSDDPILAGKYKSKPWVEIYTQIDIDDVIKEKDPLLVQGYWTKPHIRWDYEKNPDEYYARTPSWHAMNDIRSGQEFARQKLMKGQRELEPPMWAQRKYKGHIHLRPRGFTYYDKADDRLNKPEPILEQSNYQIATDVHRMINEAIERWYQIEFFRALLEMNRRGGVEGRGSWPSATHIIHLKAESATILAPRIGPFMAVLREINRRFVDIKYRAGEIPEPPDIVQEYKAYKELIGKGEDWWPLVEFIGPLAQLQQKSRTLGRVEAGLAIERSFIEIEPTLRFKVRNSVAMEKALEQVGFYQDAIVPEDEYQAILDAIAQQQKAEQLNQEISLAADAVPKLSKAVESGSPLNRMIEGAKE